MICLISETAIGSTPAKVHLKARKQDPWPMFWRFRRVAARPRTNSIPSDDVPFLNENHE